MGECSVSTNVKMSALSDLIGMAEPLDPASMQFRAKLADPERTHCSGCLFRGQRSIICNMAAQVAQRAGMNDCDERDPDTGRSFIYVTVEMDARQLDLVQQIESTKE